MTWCSCGGSQRVNSCTNCRRCRKRTANCVCSLLHCLPIPGLLCNSHNSTCVQCTPLFYLCIPVYTCVMSIPVYTCIYLAHCRILHTSGATDYFSILCLTVCWLLGLTWRLQRKVIFLYQSLKNRVLRYIFTCFQRSNARKFENEMFKYPMHSCVSTSYVQREIIIWLLIRKLCSLQQIKLSSSV